jgi:hypothetical protein
MAMQNEVAREETQVIPGDGTQGNPEETTEGEPDYKALYEKGANDLKALKAQRGKREDTDTLLRSIQEQQQAISEELNVSKLTNQALIKALAEGTTDELPDKVTQITAEANQEKLKKEGTTQAESLFAGFLAINKDDEGNLIVDEKSPEYIEAYKVLEEGFRVGSFSGIQDGYNLLHAAKFKKIQAESQDQIDTANGKRVNRQAKDDKNDMDLGPGVGGGAGKSWDQLTKITDTKQASDEEYFKAVAG